MGSSHRRRRLSIEIRGVDCFHLRTSALEGTIIKLGIEREREEDGRWLAEVRELPGVLAYGATADGAMTKAEVIALRVLAERLESGEARPVSISISFPAAA